MGLKDLTWNLNSFVDEYLKNMNNPRVHVHLNSTFEFLVPDMKFFVSPKEAERLVSCLRRFIERVERIEYRIHTEHVFVITNMSAVIELTDFGVAITWLIA